MNATGLKAMRMLGLVVMWFVLSLLNLWAVAALWVDFRVSALRVPVTVIYVLAILAILIKVKARLWAAALCFVGFGIVLAWWLSLKPSDEGDGTADKAPFATRRVKGEQGS